MVPTDGPETAGFKPPHAVGYPKTAAAVYDKAHCTEPLGIRYQRSAVSTRTFQTDTKPHIMSVSDLLPVSEHYHTAFKTRCISNKTENALLYDKGQPAASYHLHSAKTSVRPVRPQFCGSVHISD